MGLKLKGEYAEKTVSVGLKLRVGDAEKTVSVGIERAILTMPVTYHVLLNSFSSRTNS